MTDLFVLVKSDLWEQPDGSIVWEAKLLDGSGRHFEGVAGSIADAYAAIGKALVGCFPDADETVEVRVVRIKDDG